MNWIKVDINFGDPLVLLVLDLRQVIAGSIERILGDDPAVIEQGILAVIVKHRQELAGGVLLSMTFRPNRLRWEFLYSHPSLRRLLPGESLPEIPLIPHVGRVEADEPEIVGATGEPQ